MNPVSSFVEFWNEEHPNEKVPTYMVLCNRCQGNGVHDSWEGGMSSSEMDEQGLDFFDDYMSGMYDRTCSECDGRNVTREVNEDFMSVAMLAEWKDWLASYYESRAIEAQERAMGA